MTNKIQNLFFVTLGLQFLCYVFLFIHNSLGGLPANFVSYFCIPVLVFNSPLLMVSAVYMFFRSPNFSRLASALGFFSGLLGTVMVVSLIIAIKNFN